MLERRKRIALRIVYYYKPDPDIQTGSGQNVPALRHDTGHEKKTVEHSKCISVLKVREKQISDWSQIFPVLTIKAKKKAFIPEHWIFDWFSLLIHSLTPANERKENNPNHLNSD